MTALTEPKPLQLLQSLSYINIRTDRPPGVSAPQSTGGNEWTDYFCWQFRSLRSRLAPPNHRHRPPWRRLPAPGSPTNTTTAFDGTYDGSFVQSITPGSATAQCPNIRVAPVLTIRNGAARFAALNLTFQGYVTPQGALMMQSEGGQAFDGKIDPYFVLKGRVSGNCIYDATWTKDQSPRV